MRIRTVKPEFWCHPVLARLEAAARLLAIGLLNHADDGGYFYADPSLVRAAIFPFDDDSTNVRRSLAELSRVGYIEVRESPGLAIGKVVNFLKHQRIDKPRESSLKPTFDRAICRFDDASKIVIGTFVEASAPEGKGREGKEDSLRENPVELKLDLFPTDPPKPKRTATEDVDAVVSHYKALHPRARPGKDDRAKIAARLREGYSVADLVQAIDGFHRSPFHTGAENGTSYLALELFMRNSGQVLKGIEHHRSNQPTESELKKLADPKCFLCAGNGISWEVPIGGKAEVKGACSCTRRTA